jgi:hypothetical protein
MTDHKDYLTRETCYGTSLGSKTIDGPYGAILRISSTGAFLATTARLRPLSLVYLEPAGATFWETQSRRIAASVVRQDASGVGLEWCEAAAEATKVVTRLTSLAGRAAGDQRADSGGNRGDRARDFETVAPGAGFTPPEEHGR